MINKTPENKKSTSSTHKKEFLAPSRYLTLLWVAPLFYLPGFNYVAAYFETKGRWYWFDLSYYYYFHYLCIAVLLILTFVYKIKWQQMLKAPKPSCWQPAMLLTLFTFIFSTAGAYLLFYPLSFIVPEFVNSYYINIPPIVYLNNVSFPLVPNVLSLLSLTVFAPITEELIFRGLFLHRWTYKWGKTTAVILSSAIFAILHPDPVGAFAFGVAMCFLYFRYQTLIVPIVCHSLYNFVVWCYELISLDVDTVTSLIYLQTLREFQSELWIGTISGLVCFLWGAWYLKHNNLKQIWTNLEIPNLNRHPANKQK